MALTNLEMAYLATATTFQLRVASSLIKKSLAILEDVLSNGSIETPKPGHTPNFTNAQQYLSKQISGGVSLSSYYQLLARSTNVIAGTTINSGTDTSITDAALDSQVFTTVFVDLL